MNLLDQLSINTAPRQHMIQKPKQLEPFLRGPIPIRWIQLATQCGSSALVVGIILWFQRGLCKKDRVPLNLSKLAPYGLSRGTAGKALTRLETHGLVKVERSKGRKQFVHILKIKPEVKTTSTNNPNVTLR